MDTTSIASLFLRWLSDPPPSEGGQPGAPGENLVHALLRELWTDVTNAAELAVGDEYSGSARDRALASVEAASSLANAKKHSDATLAKKNFRQISEVEFRKGVLSSLSEVYLWGSGDYRF